MEIDNLWRKFCDEESWKLNWRNKSGNGNEYDKKNDWKRNDDGTVRVNYPPSHRSQRSSD